MPPAVPGPASPAVATSLPPRSARSMAPATVVLVLSLLLGIQPVTTDFYLAALPALTEGFGAPAAQAQLTLTALLLAFGISQLPWGPVSFRPPTRAAGGIGRLHRRIGRLHVARPHWPGRDRLPLCAARRIGIRPVRLALCPASAGPVRCRQPGPGCVALRGAPAAVQSRCAPDPGAGPHLAIDPASSHLWRVRSAFLRLLRGLFTFLGASSFVFIGMLG